MTRFGYVMTTYAVTMGVAIAAFVPIAPRLVWNASASAPIGLYDLAPPHPLTVGDLVAAMPDKPLSDFMVEIVPIKTGRAVTHVELRWWRKDGDATGAADRALQFSKVGRRVRAEGRTEQVAVGQGAHAGLRKVMRCAGSGRRCRPWPVAVAGRGSSSASAGA